MLISQKIPDNIFLFSHMLNNTPSHIYHVSFIKIEIVLGGQIGVQRYPPKNTNFVNMRRRTMATLYNYVALYQTSPNPQRKWAKENGIFQEN